MNLSTKQTQKNRLVVWRRAGWTKSLGLIECKPLHLEWIENKVLVYSIGNYTQYPVINHNGKEH